MFDSIKKIFGLKGSEDNEVDKKVLSEQKVEHICHYEDGKYIPEEKIGKKEPEVIIPEEITPVVLTPAPFFHRGLIDRGHHPHVIHGPHHHNGHRSVTDRLRQGRDKARALDGAHREGHRGR